MRAGGPAKFFDFNLSPAKNNGKDLILPPKIMRKPASRQNQWFEIWREIRFWIFCWGMVIRNSIDFRFHLPFLRFPIPNTINILLWLAWEIGRFDSETKIIATPGLRNDAESERCPPRHRRIPYTITIFDIDPLSTTYLLPPLPLQKHLLNHELVRFLPQTVRRRRQSHPGQWRSNPGSTSVGPRVHAIHWPRCSRRRRDSFRFRRCFHGRCQQTQCSRRFHIHDGPKFTCFGSGEHSCFGTICWVACTSNG